MWLGLIGGALASGGSVEAHMWERCVTESLLTEEDRQLARKQLVSHPPGDPIMLAGIDSIIERNPECPALWMARAGVHHAAGRSEEALVDLRSAASRGSDWPEVQRALAVALHNDGGAGDVLSKAIDLNPDDALLKIYRAEESTLSERPGLLIEAVDAHPDDLDVAIAAVRALAASGHPLDAAALARERQAHFDDADLARLLAEITAPFDYQAVERSRRPAEFRTLSDGTEEVIVYNPSQARQELENRLSELGWTDAKKIDGGSRYRSVKPLQPWVEIYDDGRVVVQTGSRVQTPEDTVSDGTSMIPVISKKKLAKRRDKLMTDIWYEVTVWRQARIRVAFQEQLGERLPDLLAGVWESGEPMNGEGSLETPAERRAELLDYWATRSCSADGDAARRVVETYLRRVVQESDQPASAEEIAGAQSSCTCNGRELHLDADSPDGVE